MGTCQISGMLLIRTPTQRPHNTEKNGECPINPINTWHALQWKSWNDTVHGRNKEKGRVHAREAIINRVQKKNEIGNQISQSYGSTRNKNMKISKKIAGLATTAEASTMGKIFYLLNMTPWTMDQLWCTHPHGYHSFWENKSASIIG